MLHKIIELNTLYKLPNSDKFHAKLHIYIQTFDKELGIKKRKSIILCPGGGYAECSFREKEPIAFKFFRLGYNVFYLDYSVAPAVYPQQSLELAAAFEALYDNAEEWCVDTDNIVLMGFSAGGHLATFYSNTYYYDEIKEYFPNAKKPKAVVLGYPVITAERKFVSKISIFNLLGKKELSDEEIEYFTSANRVTSDTPPTFIWHTFEDACVYVTDSLLYASKLKDNGIPFALHIYPYGKHGLATVDLASNNQLSDNINANDWLEEAEKWLDIVLK